jgi:hypothetical protein
LLAKDMPRYLLLFKLLINKYLILFLHFVGAVFLGRWLYDRGVVGHCAFKWCAKDGAEHPYFGSILVRF